MSDAQMMIQFPPELRAQLLRDTLIGMLINTRTHHLALRAVIARLPENSPERLESMMLLDHIGKIIKDLEGKLNEDEVLQRGSTEDDHPTPEQIH